MSDQGLQSPLTCFLSLSYNMKKRKKVPTWLRWFLWITSVISFVFLGMIAILFWNQDAIVQKGVTFANETFSGQLTLEGSHISPFANFPYISVDLEGVSLYETKDNTIAPMMHMENLYVGFNLLAVLQGNYQIKAISLQDGYLHVAQHEDGTYNILEALASPNSQEDSTAEEAPLNLDLKRISLRNIDLHKISEATDTDIDAFISQANISVALNGTHTQLDLDAKSEMSLILDGDTTYLNHKHIDVETELDYDGESTLVIAPSKLEIEGNSFQAEGSFDVSEAPSIDLKIEGRKPNFDMLIAFCPDELIPTLRSYDNRGDVFFEATVKGSIADGAIPQIDAKFGCKEGMIKNSSNNRTVAELAFAGYLKSGEDGTLESMEFGLQDFQATPETGEFDGELTIKNFISPDINLQLRSAFDLNFLVDFFGLEGLSDLSGSVNLVMNFHDIIDLNHPEKSIERLNESYFTELEIRNLNVTSEAFYLPVEGLQVIGQVEGHELKIDTLMGKVGQSDLFLSARISDLPAILHHSRDSVQVDLEITSDLLDMTELSFNDSTQQPGLDEKIRDLRLNMGFSSSASAFTESPHLPIGEFYIHELHAQLQHYPHEIHNFNADIFVEEEDLRIVDFSGELDRSDFQFTGRVEDYYRWMMDSLEGDTKLEFNLLSQRLRLEDLLSYKGKNYVPKDYQHEDVRNFALKGHSALHFQHNQLQSIDLYVDQLAGKMKIHDSRFEQFKGRIHYEDEHLTIDDFSGQIGNSDFAMDLYWYLGEDPRLQKEDHRIALRSGYLDLNQLLAWNPPPVSETASPLPVDHDTAFSLFDLPFWDMTMEADIGRLVYHTYNIQNLNTDIRMLRERYLYLDNCSLDVAGGSMELTGYFDARDSSNIYLSPTIVATDIDLDRFMVKVDNFGQDYIVSDNLHGRVNSSIEGRIHLHKDLTPMIDASVLKIDMEVLDGRLDEYEPMTYLAEYFADKNLNRIRFDTLKNTFRLENNVLEIPRMTINSSIGYLELMGTQDLGERLETDLALKIPMALVGQAAFSKLFKRSAEEANLEQEDAIIYQNDDRKQAYAYLRLLSDVDDYDVKLLRRSEIEEAGQQ